MRRTVTLLVVVLALITTTTIAAPLTEAIDAAVDKALGWLEVQQNDNGSWNYNGYPNVGVTATAAFAFLQRGYPESNRTVSKAIEFILSKQHQHDNTLFFSSDRLVGPSYQILNAVYETSLAILAFIATDNSDYEDTIHKARDYLVASQNSEDVEYSFGLSCPDSHWAYGGWGYHYGYLEERQVYSDLSNTQFALMALAAARLPIDSEVWQKAQIFVSRCQQPDGGFDYQPPQGNYPSGGSYNTMSAAGVWGLRLLGVPLDDERILNGLEWLRRHYAYHEVPLGFGDEKWHYYWLWTAARALLHSDLPGILEPHPPLEGWYWDFAGYLVEYQKEDGFWFDPTHKWSSGFLREPPEYATGLALLVLLKVAVPIP